MAKSNEKFQYEDIINFPHHVSTKHPHMKREDRAAQFSPFAALTGYEEAVKETARITDQKVELEEDATIRLNEKLAILNQYIQFQPKVTITYFQKDSHKSGGSYITKTACIKKIKEYERTIIFVDKSEIAIGDILEIESEIFY